MVVGLANVKQLTNTHGGYMEDIINNYYKKGGIAMMVQDLAKNKIEPSKFWHYFRQDYTSIDNVHKMMTNKDLQAILTYYYDDIGFSMNTKEYEIYEDILMEHDEILLYRGTLGEYEHGFSWTLDKNRAYWFATRFAKVKKDKQPVVYTGRLNALDFLVYWEQEQEVFVPPTFLHNITKEEV